MTAFKSFTALMFLVAPITLVCMEQDSRNAETSVGIQQKQHLGSCYIMVSATQSNAAGLNAFRTNKPIRLNVDLVNQKTNAIVATDRLPADYLSKFSFGESFDGEGTTGVSATFIYAKNPRLKGTTLSEQLAEAKKIALTELALVDLGDLYAQRLKQIKY